MRFPEFFDYFVITQHFRRFAASGFNNAQPFWFYVPVLCLLTLPWVGWLVIAPRKQWRAHLCDVDWLMLVWLLVVVAFFSLPRSKRIGYVLPALPPLAYFVARALRPLRADGQASQRPLRWTAGVAAAICILAVVGVDRLGTPPGARLKLPAGSSIGRDDQVLMLDTYFYELPFYWHLCQPVQVLGDWDDPGIAQRDNWRKEMSDAGHFDPGQGRRVLIRPAEVASLLCIARTTWLVGPRSAVQSWPWLADARFVLVAQNKEIAAWRFSGTESDEPACLHADTPRLPAMARRDAKQARTLRVRR